MLLSLPSDGARIVTQDTQGQRIGEDAAVLQYLVSGAVKSRRASRPAWFSGLHLGR
jgi:hypothetical protein